MLHLAKIMLSSAEVAATHKVDTRAAARLAACRAQDLGPSFVKIGQFATTRRDILPKEYFEEFALLRDDVRADPPGAAEDTVRRSLGISDLALVFSEFDAAPVASASVAQVHRARLKECGREVAVKVLKRGVREAIDKDLLATRAVVEIMAFLDPGMKHQIRSLFDRYSLVLRRETDLLAEAAAASAARQTLIAAMGDEVIVPRPIISREDLIVMEYVPSAPIRRARDKERVTSLVIESILSLIASGKGFHQDPHDGNMGVVSEGGTERLVLYDFGNVASLSRGALDGLLEASVAFQLKNADLVADALVRNDIVRQKGSRDVRPVLVRMIRQGFEYVRTMNIRSFDPSDIDKDAAHAMEVADEINGVVRSVTMAEGVCKAAHDGFDLQLAIDGFLAVHGADIVAARARRDLAALAAFF
jgi:ubiquinone biosynthesis protein